jgi:acyl carrier protein
MTDIELDTMTDQARQTVIYGKVKEILVDALSVDEEDINLKSRLQADLGAESIDFLDINFRLEREFNVKIRQDELFPANVFAGDDSYVQDGKITSEGVDKLQAAAPHAIFRDVNGNLTFDGTVRGVADVFTVRSLVNFINKKVKEKS